MTINDAMHRYHLPNPTTPEDLESDVKQYAVIAEVQDTDVFISDKLAADLNHILCGVKETMEEEDEEKVYRYDQETGSVMEIE